MTTLGNYHHDFPRLAKQSGFYFQSHKGKVDWKEIENLNINYIIENRNFQLLEQNLINVVNCNLDEFDLKLLDQNFVKLFRLAQLGVDYLSYCETYLDKCVVILQEQLLAIQEVKIFHHDFESFKYEKEKSRENGSKSKRKNKSLNYQCEKCDKAFISDVYLKFHDKRRHSVPNSPKSVDTSPKKCIDNHQRKSSIFTQTENDNARITQDEKNTNEVKLQNTQIQIVNLEQEVKDLKERLKKAENALTEKNESSKPSECRSPFPGQMCLNTMLLLLPSHQTQLVNGCHELNSGNLLSNVEILQPNSSPKSNTNTVDNQPVTIPRENSTQFSVQPEKNVDKVEIKLPNGREQSETHVASSENSEEYKTKGMGSLESDKENTDPNGEKNTSKLCKPLPPPRKSKPMIPPRTKVELKSTEQSATSKSVIQSESRYISSHPVVPQRTPVATLTKNEIMEKTVEDTNEQESTSNRSLNSSKDTLVEDKSESFFKTILRRNSPKFRTLGKNLRKSLTNIRDSVSSSGKDLKESVEDNVKTNVVDGLNKRLTQLGVDPEWSGIPKKTMRQKLKALKHRRKFLAKENPMYPIIRQNIEERIFQKIKKNIDNKKATLIKKLSKESVVIDNLATHDSVLEDATEGAKLQSCVMYDIESESESKTSESEIDINGNEEQNEPAICVESDCDSAESRKEFDLSVFQVGKGNYNKISAEKDIMAEDVESDSDDDFLEEEFKALNGLLTDERKDVEDKCSSNKENQSILKSTDGFQSRLQLNAKKKVWFVNRKNFETPLPDSSSDDDNLWKLKNESEKDVG